MSSGGYNAPHLPSPFPRYGPARPPNSSLYDRPPPPVGPPPPNAARPYDRYVPGLVASYRDEYPGPYRAPGYPPEYPSNNLYPRSPSPDRYAAAGAEHWGDGRQNYWAAARSGWPERKPIVPQSPPGLVRGRDVATLATPMFEPSENWKQKQGPHRPPPPQSMHEPYRPYYPEANPYRRDVFPVGPSRHYEPVPNPARSRSPERRHNASPMRPKQHELSRKSSKSSIASSAHHSRQPSDSAARPGSSASSGAINLYGRHRSPSSGIPGLSASLPVKPENGSPRIPPADAATNGKSPVCAELEKKPTPMEIDAVKEKEVVRPLTPPKSEKRSNGSCDTLQVPSPILTDQTVVPDPEPDVDMAPEETQPSPKVDAPTPTPVPETPAVPEVPEPPPPSPPKSPTPPPPWEDTSKVLLELKPVFPLDARPTTEPPLLPSATTFADALRSVVKLRLISDRQTRDEIVEGPLIANRAIAAMNVLPRSTPEAPNSTPAGLIEEVLGGCRHESRIERFEAVRPSLAEHFEKRRAKVTSKVERLSKEYLVLHEKWRAHCAALSEHQKSKVHTTEHEASLYVAGRTTRHRGALADAVRSDLEMEQIIASLESNDAMDPNYLSMKNAATIPDMISVTKGQVDLLFDDTNHLVEQPEEYYAVRTGIDDWTDEEKRIFIDKFAQYPKQFGMIAHFIPDKTASQCVDYYYLHKKRQIDFRKVVSQLGPKKKRRGGGRKKKGNALLTDIAQHDAEVGKLPTGFVVPTRVAKSRKGIGGRPKVTQSGAGNSATATPQPEPRSARLQAQAAAQAQLAAEAAAATTPSTPEPESARSRRGRGAKQAAAPTSGTFSVSAAPISLSASNSASSVPVSMLGPGPSPLASASVSIASTAMLGIPATPSGYAILPSPAPTPSLSVIAIPAAPVHPPPVVQVASSQSGSSSLTKMEDDDTPDLDARPTKKTKRVRKQVKSVAIIHDEPPSPPPESELPTPDGERGPEPSTVLSKTTKILSALEAKRSVSSGTSTSEEKAKAKGRSRGKAKKGKEAAAEETTPNTLDLSEAEKSLLIDLLVRHGLDFQSVALAMPGKAPHDLEKWYFANESKHKLNEAWQERLNATKAALASAVVIPSPPPMGSLTPRQDVRMPAYPTHFAPYPASASQPQSRPDYPMAIPFKPQATQTGGGANAAGATPSSTSASATPGQGSPISAFHSPYSAHPLLSAPAYGYSYASPIPFAAMYPHYPPASAVQLPSHPGTPNAGNAQPQPVNGTTSGGSPAPGPAAPRNTPAAEEAPLGKNRQPASATE